MNFLKSNLGKVAIGGTALSLAIGYGVYHYISQESRDESGLKILPKEIVIKILKDMQKEFFATFSSLAMIGIQIQQQSRNRIPPGELEYILSNQRKKILNKIIDKFFIKLILHKKFQISKIEFMFLIMFLLKNLNMLVKKFIKMICN